MRAGIKVVCAASVVLLAAAAGRAQPVAFVRRLTELNEPVDVTKAAPPKSISVQIFPGEFETVVVGNGSTVVADAAGLEVEEFGVYVMRHAVGGVLKNVPYYLVPKGMKCDSLSSLGAIRIHVPKGTPPGERLVKLKSGDLSVEVEVLPFELPRADVAFGMYWDCHRYPREYLDRDWTRILEDMRDHGQTSITAYDRADAGERTFLANGDFNPDPRNRLSRHVQVGLDVGLLSADIPVMALSGGFDGDPELAAKEAANLKAHAAEHGWPEILLYSRDEPPISAEEAVAKLHAYHKGLGFRDITAISPEPAWVMGEHLDVWVVYIRVTSALMEYASRCGSEVWTYNCRQRGTNPRFHRYYAGLYTWAMKLKGNFLWAYVHTPESLVKPDGTWAPHVTFEHVLPTPEGPIPSVGWEGRRDGTVDYRVMRLLEEELLAHPKHPAAPEIATWMHNIRLRASVDPWDGYVQDVIENSYPWDHPDVAAPSGFEASEYDAIRRQAVAYILDLRGSAVRPTPDE